jgi:hypothetical protein
VHRDRQSLRPNRARFDRSPQHWLPPGVSQPGLRFPCVSCICTSPPVPALIGPPEASNGTSARAARRRPCAEQKTRCPGRGDRRLASPSEYPVAEQGDLDQRHIMRVSGGAVDERRAAAPLRSPGSRRAASAHPHGRLSGCCKPGPSPQSGSSVVTPQLRLRSVHNDACPRTEEPGHPAPNRRSRTAFVAPPAPRRPPSVSTIAPPLVCQYHRQPPRSSLLLSWGAAAGPRCAPASLS